MVYPPLYSELYVVSDIHLGGRRDAQENFQIFNRGERLGNLIRHIAGQRLNEDVALVLNGDIIDSLAEDEVPGYVALDSQTAERMMTHIFQDDAFRPVWEAMADFVETPKRHLVFVVGNHDIELSLPVVENCIRRRLAAENESAQARICFATHGGGFSCRVAGARIFCTHGNEIDPWNWVDYNGLGQLANAINAGRAVDASKWKPNAGTQLVVDVMNAVKRRYPFVDLLKPEVAAVASVLVALDKEAFKQIDFEDAFPVLRDKVRGGLVTKNLLGPGASDFSGVASSVVAEEAAEQLLGPNLYKAVRQKRKEKIGDSEDDLLLAAEKAMSEGGSVSATVEDEYDTETLGAWDIVAGWVGLVSKEEGLRRALKDWLEDDRTFDVESEDDYFKKFKQRVGDRIDFVVTGHSHQPRALVLDGNRYYYNCGTWIRTLRLTNEVLDDEKAFGRILWPALEAGKLEALDDVEIPGPGRSPVHLLFDRTNAVRISAEGDKAVGQLLRVTGGDAEEPVELDPEPGTNPFEVGRQ